MISVEIPNDIAEYKPKLILGFTGRQVGCLVVTAAIIAIDFAFLKPYIGETLSLLLAAVPAFFAACFGWGESFTPGHIPFEKYLRSVFFETVVAPKLRKCKTTSMVVPCEKDYEPIPDSMLSPELLQHVNYVREKNNIIVVADEGKTKSQYKKKKKYKPSNLAML